MPLSRCAVFRQQPIPLTTRAHHRSSAPEPEEKKKKVFTKAEWESELAEVPVNKKYVCPQNGLFFSS